MIITTHEGNRLTRVEQMILTPKNTLNVITDRLIDREISFKVDVDGINRFIVKTNDAWYFVETEHAWLEYYRGCYVEEGNSIPEPVASMYDQLKEGV